MVVCLNWFDVVLVEGAEQFETLQMLRRGGLVAKYANIYKLILIQIQNNIYAHLYISTNTKLYIEIYIKIYK